MTNNNTVIDFVAEYSTNHKVLYNLNYVQYYKGVYLPLELVRSEGNKMTDCYVN